MPWFTKKQFKNQQKQNIAQRVFSRGNLLAVLVITCVPPLLGFLEYLLAGGGHDEFNNSLGYNLLYSFLVTASLFFGASTIIESLNRYLPWKGNVTKRIVVEVLLVFTYTSFTQILILEIMAGTPVFRRELVAMDYFRNVLFSNTITLIVMAIIEGLYFFRNWRESLVAAERLKQEHLQSRFSNLKAQLDPHFMFNSLNVLSSLIRRDPAKAEQFVEDFAQVYRYLLEVKNEMVVPLRDELQFVERYLKLQKIRFETALEVKTHINPEHLNHYLPPLSLQEMIANALKHNVISAERPLKIELLSNGDSLKVRNNLQHLGEKAKSTGIGLQNLRERYHYLGGAEPHFAITDDFYEARLPLLKAEA